MPGGVKEREGGRTLPHTSHNPHTCSLISRRTFNTTARHTTCNNSSENPAPATSCHSENGHQTAPRQLGGSFSFWLLPEFPEDHVPSPTRLPRQPHFSKEKLARSFWVCYQAAHPTGCRSAQPLPLGSDQTYSPVRGRRTDTRARPTA